MRTIHGVIAEVPWVGHIIERADDLPAFDGWVRNQRGTVAFDTETCGLGIFTHGPGFIRVAQFGTKTEAWFLPVEYGPQFAAAARRALENLPSLVGHNVVMFDGLAVDRHLGFPLEKLCAKTTDTLIVSKLIDPRQPQDGNPAGHSLKGLSAAYVDPTAPDTGEGLHEVFRSYGYTKKSGLGWANVPITDPTYERYGCLDVILSSHLLDALRAEHARLSIPPMLVEYEHQLLRMAAVMSRTGMVVDQEYTRQLDAELSAEAEASALLAAEYGVESINSTRQLADSLLAMGETLTERTDSGALKVDKAVLLALADLNPKWERLNLREPNPLADAVLHGKRAGKWRTTYAETFLTQSDEHGRIHPGINTLQARTGRMSITRPAVQTLPSGEWKIRRALLADEGHVMISTDFAAVELRVLAAVAGVKQMKRAISDGEDLHSFTARLVFGDNFTPYHRKISKGIAFGTCYGGGAATISRQTGAPLPDVQRAVGEFNRVYPEIKQAGRRWQDQAFNNGMVLTSITGRRLPLDRDRTYAATNYMIQSAARDVLGQAMIVADERGLLPYLRLPIHDELLASVPKEDAEDIAHEIEECMTLDLFGVPITAEADVFGRSWGSGYQTKGERDADPMG